MSFALVTAPCVPLTRTIVTVFTIAAACVSFGGAAQAYSYTTCSGNNVRWNSSRTTMSISTTSFPGGSTWDSRLQNAMWHWNNVRGAGFNFFVGRDTDGSHRSGNGVNEVYLAGSSELGSALAVTFRRSHCYWLFGWHYGIDEADVGFNSAYSWSTGVFNYSRAGSSPYSFEGVALHEFGHALGLGHEDRWMATLNSFYPNSGPLGGIREWDPFGDDRLGVRFLYRDGSVETDIAGSALKRTGTGTSGLVTSSASASRGGTATLQFTFTNLSTAAKSFNINFYLSSNSIISTGDTLLGINTGASAGAGGTGTFSRTLTIPSWIAPGTYYLGFLLDPGNALPENNEVNNWQNMPRTIRIF